MSGLTPTSLAPATLPSATTTAAASRAATGSAASFESMLDAAGQRSQQIGEAGDQLVSTAFVLPLLSQLRDSPFKSEMFDGGQAEQIFGQQLDTILADRITSSANFGISDALVRQFDPAAASKVDLRG